MKYKFTDAQKRQLFRAAEQVWNDIGYDCRRNLALRGRLR
jgi:hypothetical protein